jgi:Icc-related predicted phosphoesterase
MSVLISGDFYSSCSGELSSITKKALKKKYGREKFSQIKYHVILGDACFMWPGNQKSDVFNYKVLNYRPFPVLCVLGNHDPVLGMKDIKETDIGIGETVLQINDNPFVAYLKRGKIYHIDELKFLVLGGALSVDKEYQVKNKTWWEREYWSYKEKEDVLKLIKTENVFDFVLSHTGPDSINRKVFEHLFVNKKINDEVAVLNDEIIKKITFQEWWAGHFHRDIYHYDMEKKRGYQYLYRTTRIVEKADGRITVYKEFGETNR